MVKIAVFTSRIYNEGQWEIIYVVELNHYTHVMNSLVVLFSDKYLMLIRCVGHGIIFKSFVSKINSILYSRFYTVEKSPFTA